MTLRVASVPADHPYVAHLASPADSDATGGADGSIVVERLPDPPVLDADGVARWWPPRMLDPDWLRQHRDEFDLLHVHFGFESFTPKELSEVAETSAQLGKPLVVTVHDLRNPHLADAEAHLERLGALVEAADAVITLTPGAAAEIRRRWHREAEVIPHPHIVPLETIAGMSSRTPISNRSRIGLHLKSFRRNVDASGALEALALVADQRDIDIVVTLHTAVADPDDRGYDDRVVPFARQLHDDGHITLQLHEPMSDDELFAHVGGLDLSVMANVWGTHSGWIEMCRDLGTRVLAPNIGFYTEQHDPAMYDLADDGERIAPERLAAAILRTLDLPAPPRVSVEERRAERRRIAEAHARIYAEVCATRNESAVHSTSPASAKERSQPSIGQVPHRSR